MALRGARGEHLIKKVAVLVVIVPVTMNIFLVEITFEMLPVGHLLEFLVVGKEPGDCALFPRRSRLCMERSETAKQR